MEKKEQKIYKFLRDSEVRSFSDEEADFVINNILKAKVKRVDE